MANLKQSKKRIKYNRKHHLINKNILSSVKTYIKKFLKNLTNNNFNLNKEYSFVVSKIDKAAQKGVIKKGKSNRLKSNLFNKLKLIKGM